MSTTRPCSPGDRGPEPCGASGASEGGAPETGASAGAAAPSESTEGVQEAAGRQVRRLRLDGESGVVPLARDYTRQALSAEDVLLVVSELVTNACLHAGGPEELFLACDDKVIRVEVTDRGTGQPAPRTPHRAGRPGGHGMFIVQRLCLDWGVVRTPGRSGKTVWAELGAPA